MSSAAAAAAAATASLSSISSNPTSFPHSRTRRIKTEFLLSKKSIIIRIFSSSSSASSSSSSVLRNTTTSSSSSLSSVLRNTTTTTTTTYGGARRRRRVDRNPGIKPFFIPVMQWQDCSAKMEVDVPCSVAYKCYSDRETIPRWMPFISSVKIVEDKPDLSLWSLKYKAFGQDIEFSWLARNLQPIPNQKIHWRSLEGLPNRGVVRFYPKGSSSCVVDLTVSYEVPQILTPVASALKPFLESLLLNGLERFTKVAKSYPQV